MDSNCQWIIGGLVVAILGLAGYVKHLHASKDRILLEWIKSLRDQDSLLNLVDDANPGAPKGGH